MLRQESYRLEGLEYYSTCLWKLEKQVDLCYLSHYVMERSVLSPESWCVMGNCFALQKENEQALKCFGRAIQLDVFFSYAHTLSGHEYVENEDFEAARKCYSEAIKSDDRNYIAWWGLGNIYQRQERYDQALFNFNQAVNINSRESKLLTYLGIT